MASNTTKAPHPADAALSTLADEAFVYALPLFEMHRMRSTTSPRRCERAGFAGDGPGSAQKWCNLFAHNRALIEAGSSRVVTPNNDTLYSNAWLDLSAGPLVIDVPDTLERYYVLGLLDFYTNPFAHIGQRCTGTQARSFFITGPNWHGTVPEAFSAAGSHIQAPTSWVWIIGRILIDQASDLAAVHALQDQLQIRSLADWTAGALAQPTRFTPLPESITTPAVALDTAQSAEYFRAVVCHALQHNPGPAAQKHYVERFKALGISADEKLDRALTPTQAQALQQAIEKGLQALNSAPLGQHDTNTGWNTMPRIDENFGTDYARRALIALRYIGALESNEALYYLTHQDAQGEALNGAKTYQLHFSPDTLPCVHAFWSLTIYNSHDCMLVSNPIGRYAIGDRSPHLRYHADGGLTLYIQHQAPSESENLANWLPAPVDDFYLCLRAYLPQSSMFDAGYALPKLTCSDNATGL